MQNLNLKHLRYFWMVAKHNSLSKAAELLFITPQTISGQISDLEKQLNKKLFRREGRNLVMTETGQLVFSYADEIFNLSNELQQVLHGQNPGKSQTLRIGIAMVVPKLLAYRILQPVLENHNDVHLICNEQPLVGLLADLSIHKLDIILTDSPLNPALNIRAYNHQLGQSGISFFAVPGVARKLSKNFPESLNDQDFLMPNAGSLLRRNLDNWFQKYQIKPKVIAEFEDRALMKVFGEGGSGIFTSPTVVKDDVLEKYGVEIIGETEEITEQFYLITAESHIKNPAISLISETARKQLFSH